METNNKTAPAVQEKDRNAISLELMNREITRNGFRL